MKRLKRILPVIGLITGICIIAAYPALDLYYSFRHKTEGKTIQKAVSQLSPEDYKEYQKQAESYNASLVSHEAPEDLWPYEKQLSVEGEDKPFAVLVIPEISLSMPVYHGTSEEVLMNGVGHLEGTSLPAGGENTHAVLTAHSGMNGMRAFDDIRQLKEGDEFFIKVLGKTLAYQVYKTEIVWPSEAEEKIGIEEGKDLVTLITCTPYGVNDHRLLVHAKRCPYRKSDEKTRPSVTRIVTNRRYGPFVLAVILVLLLIVTLIIRRKHRK